MFENNFDFDLDENIFSDNDFLLPSEDKTPKAANCVRKEPKEIDASNLFKQPLVPAERLQRGLTNTNNNKRHKSEKQVVQRKFPGPAGLLPEIRRNNSIANESGGVNNDLDEMLMCSQTSLSMFQEEPWTTMRSDFKAESNYTIEWIKSNATGKTLVNQKAPFLAAVVKSIECTAKLKMPTLTLKDPTDEIQADISHELYEEHANDLTVGSVIVLRQFSVFSVKNETVHHLTITSNNLVAVYNKERRCRLDFGRSKKFDRGSPISSSSSCDANKCWKRSNDSDRDSPASSSSSSSSCDANRCWKRSNDSGRLELDALRNYAPVVTSVGKVRSSLEFIHKIRDHKAEPESRSSFDSLNEASISMPKTKSSFDTLHGASASMFKFRADPNLKPNEADDLNLSLDLFSEEFSTDSPLKVTGNSEVKTESVSPGQNKLGVDEECPPLKKSKTTTSQKLRDFKFKPRDDPETDCKIGGNFIDCSQISIVSQNAEDRDILQDVFHNVDAESLFEDF